MRVSFDGGRLNERGVAVAMFDYALHARAELGVEPVILHDVATPPEPQHVQRFESEFAVYAYATDDQRQRLIERERIDVAYVLKTTRHDLKLARSCRSAVHEVFRFFNPHGDSYAYISSWLAEEMTGGRYPFVPHIVDLPSARNDLRREFGVPRDAFVVGRHGGADQFNVPFVPAAIEAALEARKNLWFLLMNTNRFSDHERIIHVPGAADRGRVADFVAACDAGINARRVGETFGLAIAEFLSQDKPALVWRGGRDGNHVELVANPDFIYESSGDLTNKLVNLEASPFDGRFAARVEAFAPRSVMQRFGEVFLTGSPQPMPKLPLGHRQWRKARETWRRWRDERWIRT